MEGFAFRKVHVCCMEEKSVEGGHDRCGRRQLSCSACLSHVAGNDTTSQILLCFFSFCQRTQDRLEMTPVCCLSNSSTKCCLSITIHLRNCLSHYLYPNCLKQMALYTLNSCPSHFNHDCPVIWDSSPERGKRKASTFTL